MSFSVSVEETNELPVVCVGGDVDRATAPEFAAALDAQIQRGARHLVVEAGAVTFFDSSGLGILVATHKQLRRNGGSLRIANPSRRVLWTLRMTGLDTVFPVYNSVEEAVALTE